jgi:hypothetical protein
MAQPRDGLHSGPLNLSAGANKLGLLAGLTAGFAYSTYASFVANALTPVTVRLIEADSFRRAVSGHYQEVLSFDGAIPTVLASLIVFVLVWLMTRVMLEHWQSSDGQRIDSIDSSSFAVQRNLSSMKRGD